MPHSRELESGVLAKGGEDEGCATQSSDNKNTLVLQSSPASWAKPLLHVLGQDRVATSIYVERTASAAELVRSRYERGNVMMQPIGKKGSVGGCRMRAPRPNTRSPSKTTSRWGVGRLMVLLCEPRMVHLGDTQRARGVCSFFCSPLILVPLVGALP